MKSKWVSVMNAKEKEIVVDRQAQAKGTH